MSEPAATIHAPPRGEMSLGRRIWRRTDRARYVTGSLIVACLVWEGLCRHFHVKPFVLPPPSSILVTIFDKAGFLAMHAGYTLIAVLLGFAFALTVGVAFAIAVVHSKFLEKTVFTVLIAFNAMPKVAIAPLFVIWVGTAIESKVLIAFLVAIFPVVVDSVQGFRSIDPEMLDLARSYQGTPFDVFWKIRFPQALPYIFAGMKVAVSLALIGAIVGEFVGANVGLGYVIMQAQGTYQTSLVFAALVVLAIIGTLLFQATDLLERLVMPWHVAHRKAGETP